MWQFHPGITHSPLPVMLATYGCLGLYVRIIRLVCRLSVIDRIFRLSGSSLLFVCSWSGWLFLFWNLFFLENCYLLSFSCYCNSVGFRLSFRFVWHGVFFLIFSPLSGIRYLLLLFSYLFLGLGLFLLAGVAVPRVR